MRENCQGVGGAAWRYEPHPLFDTRYYLAGNPDIDPDVTNPLLHYLSYGQYEGRLPRPMSDAEESEGEAPVPVCPSPEDWRSLEPASGGLAPQVDVVVPVYKGYHVTLRCIHSVLAHPQRTPFELIVINDASPDAVLIDELRALAGRGLFTLLENETNQGYVYSANLGMNLHPDRDVVQLNSDAEVSNDWLDRLKAAAYREDKVATVTPLSNNATICSYPRFNRDNPAALELDYAELDRLAAKANAGVSVATPTGIGFCMYVRRDCIEAVGIFDQASFGKGYGEENDFCQRAQSQGWQNLIACDIFVRHWGSASFQGQKGERVAAALTVLAERHPAYHRDVRDFIKRDPLAEFRRRLDLGRLQRHAREQNVLIINHNRGGGAERCVSECIEQFRARRIGTFLMRPDVLKHRVTIGHPEVIGLPNLPTLSMENRHAIVELLEILRITEVHVHHLVDMHDQMMELILLLAREHGMRLRIYGHDYLAICPRINLVDHTRRYCGEPDMGQCTRCLKSNGSDFDAYDIVAWRKEFGRLLAEADEVFVPDGDVADRLGRYFPAVTFSVSPHEELDLALHPETMPRPAPGEKLRIAVIGAIGIIKGYEVLLACALDAHRRGLAIEFVVLGYTMDDRKATKHGISITGRYLEAEAEDKLKALNAHAIWLPSIWPETYSYTLTLGLKSGLPVHAFDIGAIANRLRVAERDRHLMPLSWVDFPQRINEHFLRSAGMPQQDRGRQRPDHLAVATATDKAAIRWRPHVGARLGLKGRRSRGEHTHAAPN